MLSRRFFLRGAGTVALAHYLTGCGNLSPAEIVLLLQGSIPTQLLNDFRKQVDRSKSLTFKPEAQLKNVMELLRTWEAATKGKKEPSMQFPFISQKTPDIADLLTLGDYWLASAIQEQLIQPLKVTELSGWQQLPSRWQRLVRRNQRGEPDENGQIWGAPYRWGSTAIAYRRDKFETLGWTPTDWQDLWQESLRDRISLIDQPREIIGLSLKKLGYSYNAPDLSQIPDLKADLIALNQQVKYYSSDRYLQPLLLGDTWLAVGWSHDILPLVSSNAGIAAVIPQSGTALWADVWVKPAGLKDTEAQAALPAQWINFCWQPPAAKQISLFTHAASPLLETLKPDELPPEVRNNPLLFVDPLILDKSDFLYPLASATLQQYSSLWKEMRGSLAKTH
jgi:putative spermidine/putrescine transport system substrate-binding protein